MTATVARPAAVADSAATALLHLRPVVHASPTSAGVHVRGWSSSFTVSGGPAVWRVWQLVAATLTDGATPSGLGELTTNPSVRAVISTLLDQLHAHDMLVELPPGWSAGELPAGPSRRMALWLQSAAGNPAAAWHRLASARVQVHGDGLVAAAARRSLAASGISHDVGAPGRGTVLVSTSIAVAARCDNRTGFVSPPASEPLARRHAIALDARLQLDGPPEPVLAALVGAAAAHRIVCAIAGMPDPSSPERAAGSDVPAAALGFPTVLVARLDPLRASFHAWPSDLPGDIASSVAPPASRDLAAALVAADALCDAEVGMLPPPGLADLPQVPAGLAAMTTSAGTTYGVAATPEVARLVAVLGAIERGLDSPVAVGADRQHAEGVLLRRLAVARPATGPLLPEEAWAADPMARRWWKALALRFGVPARVEVRAVANGVFRAELTTSQGVLSRGIEASPGDAVAFAALAAVGAQQWAHAGHDTGADRFAACGATPVAQPHPSDAARWQYGPWTWPASAAREEPALQQRLREIAGDRVEFLDAADLPGAAGVLAGCAIARVRR